MARFTIVCDLNRCVGCTACNTACKTVNDVEIGNYRTRVYRVGPYPRYEGANFPDVDWYYLPMQCQHCENAPCVEICPTGATFVNENGIVELNSEACIGCQSCVPTCPYEVRYFVENKAVVDKCDMCAGICAEGGIPQCVSQCVGLAKWYGDLDEDPTMLSFKGGNEETLGEAAMPFTEDDVYTLPDEGNGPSIRYILRGKEWKADANFKMVQGGRGMCLPNL